MDRNKLSVLVNQLGGYNEAESVTGVDAEIWQRAVIGESLSTFETAQIDNAYSQFILDSNLASENNVDIAEIDDMASNLFYLTMKLHNAPLVSAIRDAIAAGILNRYEITDRAVSRNYLINFNPPMQDDLLNLLEDRNAEKLHQILEALIDDFGKGMPFFNSVDPNEYDSEFWVLWREFFYNE